VAVMVKLDASDCGDQPVSITRKLRGANVAIIGGGEFCRKLLDFFQKRDLSPHKPNIIAVADINPDAEGYQQAHRLGLITSTDYREILNLDQLDVILEITDDPNLAAAIRQTKPPHVELIDQSHARYLWDSLQAENNQRFISHEFQRLKDNPAAVEDLFQLSFDCFNSIIARRNARSREIELELLENERTQSQIIQGSTIPTFVINKDHIVTHWNTALEKLTGQPAGKVVGTKRQWAPFWQKERPTMADVILDQTSKEDIQKLYGSHWRKSMLIEGAYEAEVFFPTVGESGKWLWFTAAPIKAPDGTIVGAIETLWDKTEDKKAEQERERHTKELAALCSIYTALSAPRTIDQRIEAALKEIHSFLAADDICIFVQDLPDPIFLKYHYGKPEQLPPKDPSSDYMKLIKQIQEKGNVLLIERLDPTVQPELAYLAEEGFQVLAMTPISVKKQRAIGVMQIAGRQPAEFEPSKRQTLEIIGNRLGAAIENAILQERYIKSEEKYRSLFDNDPNPIFIVDQEDLVILDINERALECYEFSRGQLCGKPFMALGDPDDSQVLKGLKQLELGQSVLFSKKQHYRKSGRAFYVNISVSHARYGESNVLIATTSDITESIERETQLIQASKMTTLGLMAAGMAHEINQPLNVIQICADFFLKMIRRGLSIPEADLKSMANDIIANVDRATGIIKHVRHFARQSEVVKTMVNINAPIEDVFRLLGHQLKVHQIELDLDLDPDIPYIMADHNRLEQVFINLVTNAVDALDEKADRPEHAEMTKRLKIQTRLQNRNVVVTVSDNGIGMSEETRGKLFEPFFTTKKIGKGTGLGVSISYGIIKDYQGTIDITSQVSRGTTFTLTFPVLLDPGVA
jgi:PAS domain S-box-containing protein